MPESIKAIATMFTSHALRNAEDEFPLSIYWIKFLVLGNSLRMPKTGLGSNAAHVK